LAIRQYRRNMNYLSEKCKIMFPERGGLPNEIWEKIIQKVAGASAVKMEDISSLAALRATCIDFKHVVDNKTALWIGVPTKSPMFNLDKVGHIDSRNKVVKKIGSIESFDSGAILDVGKIHSKCENGAQKLVRAVLDNRLDICKLVLNRLKDKNPMGTCGMPPNVRKSVSVLHVAAMAGRHKIYQLIVDQVEREMKKKYYVRRKKCYVSTSQVKNPRSNDGSTPLHHAAMLGHYKMCSTILKNVCGDKAVGAKDFKDEDINPKNKDMSTPLHHAAKKGHLKICTLIINQVRDKNPRDINGITPLHMAANEGHLEVCQLISSLAETNNPQSNVGVSPLYFAVQGGHFEVAKFFLDLVENKNPTENDISLLHLAACKGHFKIFQHIFGQVEEKNPSSINGYTPLDWAAKEGHLDICRLILDHIEEKNPKRISPEGHEMTPLHIAARKGRLEICRLIIDQVSDKNPGNARGKTPLHYAARNGHFETCQLITKSVKDIHPRDSDGNTPLLLAVDRNHLDIVKLFLDNPDKDPLIEDEIREALRFLCGKKANHETEEP